ncbi:hypothetical protein V6N11_068499 [Hibiscus sabdariffa]|uniref:TF-B3 domain-containing protein n=1 Tax=Hibiscus sabdariffa TaxID=183260 RepID=A0ABR2PAA3_9ROSI
MAVAVVRWETQVERMADWVISVPKAKAMWMLFWAKEVEFYRIMSCETLFILLGAGCSEISVLISEEVLSWMILGSENLAELQLDHLFFPNIRMVDSDEKEKAKCNKRKRATYDGLYENAELKSAVMERALQIQANLSPEFPSLVKYMLPSHVTGGFWLGLPKHFCSNHLPKEDRIMVLEDEEGEEFEAKYLVVKVGLSGGWRGFSIAHKLLEGKEHKICENRISVGKTENGNNPVPHSSNLEPTADQSENGRMDLSSEVSDGVRLSESIVNFKDVKSFEDFNIVANGLNLDSEISNYLQMKYYELCCNQKSFLHENLLERLNCKLVAGVIAETINIADAIRAAKFTTSQDSFLTWDKTLKSFEGLGMKVGFLRARLDQLMNLSTKSKRYKEAKLEQANANEEKQKLEAKLAEVTKTLSRLDKEIGSFKRENADDFEALFQQVANAAW